MKPMVLIDPDYQGKLCCWYLAENRTTVWKSKEIHCDFSQSSLLQYVQWRTVVSTKKMVSSINFCRNNTLGQAPNLSVVQEKVRVIGNDQCLLLFRYLQMSIFTNLCFMTNQEAQEYSGYIFYSMYIFFLFSLPSLKNNSGNKLIAPMLIKSLAVDCIILRWR